MAEDQGELFPTYDPADKKYSTWKGRQKAIGAILRRWDKENRKRRETKAEHDHCEAGGTEYMKNAFREV